MTDRRSLLRQCAETFPNAAKIFAALEKLECLQCDRDDIMMYADDLRHAAHDVACAYEDETAPPCQATLEHYRAEAAE